MRKGFIHIVEIIIIVLAMFFIILQFGFIPRIDVGFDDASQLLQANDIIFSLESRGIDWFNASDINNSLYTLLPSTSRYSLKITNTIKSRMEIACICNSTEIGMLSSALSDFTINDRPIKFNITQIDSTDGFAINKSFSLKYDVIFLGPDILNPATGQPQTDSTLSIYENRMLAFLRNDRGIVMLRDINDAGPIPNVQQQVFGINKDGNRDVYDEELLFTGHLRNSSTLSLPVYPNKTFFSIYKNYYNIPLFNESFDSDSGRWVVSGGTWTVANGDYEADCLSGDCFSLAGNSKWDNYVLETRIFMLPGFAGGIGFRQNTSNPGDGIWFIMNTTSNEYFFAHRRDGTWYYNTLSPTHQSYSLGTDKWYKVRVEAAKQQAGIGDIYVAEVFDEDGIRVAAVTSMYDSFTGYDNGTIGLYASSETGGSAFFDDVRVKPAEPERFPNFLEIGVEKIGQTDGNENRIILMQQTNRSAAVIANVNIANSRGRAVWISEGNDNDPRKQALIRDVVVWASGDEMDIIKEEIRNPFVVSIFKVLNKDYLESIEIVFSIGSAF